MKKIVSITTIFLVLFFTLFSIKTYAAELTNLDVSVDKTTVHPGEEVTVTVIFGEALGAYTVDFFYDSDLFEYITSTGGETNDDGTKVRIVFHDSTGGTQPQTAIDVTFKAKSGIITSNPTNFSVTLEGLANADASENFEDITIPIIKNVVVEPRYVDYDISLNYTGDVIKNEQKPMKLIVSSTMGKNYPRTRIIGSVTTPEGGSAKLFATDSEKLEHDILLSGWGSADGDPIGGQNVVKELDVRGLFTVAGDYNITLSLIDREDSDKVIASENIKVTVKDAVASAPEADKEQEPTNTTNTTKQPAKLPKTGNTIYFVIVPILVLLVLGYVTIKKKN